MSTTHREPSTLRVLAADPELGRYLGPDEFARAETHTLGTLDHVSRGSWACSLDGRRGLEALLVLGGLLIREVGVGRGTSVELLGAGDVILSVPRDHAAGFVEPRVSWTALETTRVVVLGQPFAMAARRWPGLWMALCERVEQRAQRVACTSAIGQLVRVDDRVLALLWLLSERWGRVTPDGVSVDLRITHRLLGHLVGAQRPSVTTAMTRLEAKGTIARRAQGGWLLRGSRPGVAAAPAHPARWHRAAGTPRLSSTDAA